MSSDPMSLYKKAAGYGKKAKKEADAFMQSLTSKYTADHPAPDEEIAHGLENIIHKYESNKKENHTPAASHAKPHSNHSSKPEYLGLAGILGSVAAFGAGIPILGIAGLVATYYMAYGNQTKELKPAH